MIALLALTDKCNVHNGKHQAPIGIFKLNELYLIFKINLINLFLYSFLKGFIFVLASLIMAFGLQACSINPAREIAGRLLTSKLIVVFFKILILIIFLYKIKKKAIIGLSDRSFSPLNSMFWLIGGIVGPIVGGLIGSWVYYLLIEIHSVDEDIQKEETDVSTQTPEKEPLNA